MNLGRDQARPFDPQLDVRLREDTLGFTYGNGIFAPEHTELRSLDAIRMTLVDPDCTGPDPVYAIAMDVGRHEHRKELQRRMLLVGVVAFAAGRLGSEPVRSQGHLHAVAPHCGWSTPELIEVWHGRAIVYMQQRVADDPGSCVAVALEEGGLVVVPPGWGHCVINADPHAPLLFGAFCDRQYAFEYDALRGRGGLSWFARLDANSDIEWHRNRRYGSSSLTMHTGRSYEEFGIAAGVPIYEQFARDPERVQWVSDPARFSSLWPDFQP